MPPMRGPRPIPPRDLVRAEDRLTFLHVERCVIHRADNALTVTDQRGVAHVPVATLSVLMLGPGVRITHSAISLLAESGTSVVWVGEEGVRYYAHGSSPARSTRLLEKQAALVSDPRTRVRVARRMYLKRFEGEDVEKLSLQQLRGREGARVRRIYRRESRRTSVPWAGREYTPDDFDAGDPVNRALSSANSALYGVVHAVIVSLGCSPGLGFVHTGNYRSFVYDIADLYKADLSIPVAFDVAASGDENVGTRARIAIRDAMRENSLIGRCIRDIKDLLSVDEDVDPDALLVEELRLWDDRDGTVAGGVAYVEEGWAQEP